MTDDKGIRTKWIMPRYLGPVINPAIVQNCRNIITECAVKYQIPPAFVVAHVRGSAADAARKEAMRRILTQIGLRRTQLAKLFGRSPRRVRKSVLGV